MLEAITQGLAQPRDEFGRFAPKTAAELKKGYENTGFEGSHAAQGMARSPLFRRL